MKSVIRHFLSDQGFPLNYYSPLTWFIPDHVAEIDYKEIIVLV